MKKYSFLALAAASIVVATVPTICMENPLNITEIPTFTFELELSKMPQSALNSSSNRAIFDTADEHLWSVLRIEAEKDTNIYFTDKALFKNQGSTDSLCWRNYSPKGLPLSQQPKPSNNGDLAYEVRCPSSFPESFVNELKERGSLTLKEGLFQQPATIIFTLKDTKDTTNNSTKKYMLFGGLGICIATLIAWLVYLQQNNRLDISQITNFFNSPTKK